MLTNEVIAKRLTQEIADLKLMREDAFYRVVELTLLLKKRREQLENLQTEMKLCPHSNNNLLLKRH
jgi:hypothetical protein